MKKQKAQPLSNLLSNYFRALGIEDKFFSARIVNNWENIVGAAVAKNTSEIFVDKSILYIKIQSAPLKNELNYIKDQIKDKINNYLDRNFITSIVIFS